MKLGELRKLVQTFPDLQQVRDPQRLYEQIRSLGLDPDRLYQELEMTARYVETHQDISYSGAPVQLHSHSFYELLYCCDSCGAEYLVGPERYRLQEGDLVFVPPGVSHRPVLPERMAAPYRRYVLWLSEEFMQWYSGLFPDPFTKQDKAGILRTRGGIREGLRELFHAGVQETERQEEGWEAAVVGNTIRLLTQIKRATQLRTVCPMEAQKPELLDRICAYIEAHYAEDIRIDALSRQFFVSSSTVSHLFKQKLGVSLYRYVTQRRLIAAKTAIGKGLLLETVAAQTGFSDYSGFYRAFKQEFGISPRQYRDLQAPADR